MNAIETFGEGQMDMAAMRGSIKKPLLNGMPIELQRARSQQKIRPQEDPRKSSESRIF